MFQIGSLGGMAGPERLAPRLPADEIRFGQIRAGAQFFGRHAEGPIRGTDPVLRFSPPAVDAGGDVATAVVAGGPQAEHARGRACVMRRWTIGMVFAEVSAMTPAEVGQNHD